MSSGIEVSISASVNSGEPHPILNILFLILTTDVTTPANKFGGIYAGTGFSGTARDCGPNPILVLHDHISRVFGHERS